MNWQDVIFFALVCGAITTAIGQRKNMDVPTAFLCGALLGIIGIVIVAARKPGLPKAPAGMRAVKCPRCNTVQNIPQGDARFDCYQCHHSFTVKPIPEKHSQ
jgi:hypothetical protein